MRAAKRKLIKGETADATCDLSQLKDSSSKPKVIPLSR
eukprot:CAMPEP_0114486990 /NCGR_PEP_ID=MMETSP0109-20121206/518_1 /TAXON_ID=29199 /ORGANISM="Chlorarachnion reptans, Strain CCCM449" /LENGTH=37 /DNA_ID= /DNA_START= /DNA_END= /DNA_ORIENTATION=